MAARSVNPTLYRATEPGSFSDALECLVGEGLDVATHPVNSANTVLDHGDAIVEDAANIVKQVPEAVKNGWSELTQNRGKTLDLEHRQHHPTVVASTGRTSRA